MTACRIRHEGRDGTRHVSDFSLIGAGGFKGILDADQVIDKSVRKASSSPATGI